MMETYISVWKQWIWSSMINRWRRKGYLILGFMLISFVPKILCISMVQHAPSGGATYPQWITWGLNHLNAFTIFLIWQRWYMSIVVPKVCCYLAKILISLSTWKLKVLEKNVKYATSPGLPYVWLSNKLNFDIVCKMWSTQYWPIWLHVHLVYIHH